MLSRSILLGLLSLGGGALASYEVNRAPDGTLTKVTYKPGGDGDENPPVLGKRDCTHNNCLRAMIARPESATSFCRTYTTAVQSTVEPFTQCTGPAKASSACSCFVPAPTPPPCGGPGAFCDAAHFVQQCCDIPGCVGCKGCNFPTGDPNNGYCD
ncbi:hypothetical protein MAPG_00236 [Magnaporthiopsis poae ATCC 64411]|uniref:Uncharacterized protein n=1 Tax=Magnaporthiopsis poae (strain ATCC 64411 / 73-15) TaxID=644358 RepID=A0A0C4DKG4_MAGP6|nr:hypothetical protein MAPG_00236 [Magnaporthiopsis poae ATCC 64411]